MTGILRAGLIISLIQAANTFKYAFRRPAASLAWARPTAVHKQRTKHSCNNLVMSEFSIAVPTVAVGNVPVSAINKALAQQHERAADFAEESEEAAAIDVQGIAMHELGSYKAQDGFTLHDVDALLQDFPNYRRDHVFHDTLNQYDRMTCPYVLHSNKSTLLAVVRFGTEVRGHPDIVHGGIISLTFDNLLGWLSFLDERPNVLTAYLHVDFKAPLRTASLALVEVHMDRQEGRKLFFAGSITSLDKQTTLAVCNSLFVIPKDNSVFEKRPPASKEQ